MSNRTPEQRRADEFDLALSRLIQRADAGAANMNHRRDWQAIAAALHGIRRTVRPMMHPDDAKACIN